MEWVGTGYEAGGVDHCAHIGFAIGGPHGPIAVDDLALDDGWSERAFTAIVRGIDPAGPLGEGEKLIARSSEPVLEISRQIAGCRRVDDRGEWKLRAACAAAVAWSNVVVSVKVSSVQLRSSDLIALVDTVLSETGLEAQRLEFEFPKGVLTEDEERGRFILHALKARGVQLAMDDSDGAPFSLDSLRSFHLDAIKIGRRFIGSIEGQESGRTIVQGILGVSKVLDLPVTAGSLEAVGQLLRLSLDDCSEVQGFLLAQPMSAAAVSALLKQNDPTLASTGYQSAVIRHP